MSRTRLIRLILAAASMMASGATSSSTLILSGDGFTVGAAAAHFKVTTRASAIALVGNVLGKPTEVGSHGDCGQGEKIGYARFRGDFELSFISGKLSGWTEDSPGLATGRKVRVGMTVAELRKAYPDVTTDPGDEANGGLGPSFEREGGPYGWIDGVKASSRIIGLFAGATCLSGI